MESIIILLMCAFRLAPLFLAANIMSRKYRSSLGGFMLGLFLGWIGVIIAAFWPDGQLQATAWENTRAQQMQLPEPTIIDDIHFTPSAHEPEYVEAEIIPAARYNEAGEKVDRVCAYCDEVVPKTAMYCYSCGKLLDTY